MKMEDYKKSDNPNPIMSAKIHWAKLDIDKVAPAIPKHGKEYVNPVTDLKYRMDGYLIDNLKEVPKFLKKSWDCVIIVSGNAKVRIGKLLPMGSNILMADGSWKKIENINIGDKIISPSIDGRNSSIATISGKTGHNNLNSCEVRSSKNNKLLYTCCEEHNVPVRTLWIKTFRNGKPTEYTWKDEIYMAGDLADKNSNWYKNHCPKTITSPVIKNFETKDCDVDPYLAGLYLGDGFVTSSKRIGLANPDEKIFEYLKKTYGATKNISKKKYPNIAIKYDAAKIEKLFGKGAYNKKIPNEVLCSSYDYRKKLFEGLLDTDSYVNQEGYVTYTTASEELAKGVMKLSKTLGCRVSIELSYKNCQSFKEKRKYYNVYINVGKLSKELNLLRKIRKERIVNLDLDNIINYESQYEGITISRIQKKIDGYCIEVDSESRLYVTDNYVVTHNSTIAMQIAYFLAWLINERNKKTGEVPKDNPVPFNNSNVAFDPDALMKIAERKPRNSVIVYDEGRAGLDSARAMENINKAMQDFFQECGQYGHIILIVLPDFFKLNETIAVPRSLFLINCYTDKNYNRGFFDFYSEHRKELLYIIGKKKWGSTSKYMSIDANFYGRFNDYFPLNKEIYDEQKKIALKSRRKTRFESRWRLERDIVIWILKKKLDMSDEEISKEIRKYPDMKMSRESVQRIVIKVKRWLQKEQFEGLEDEDYDNDEGKLKKEIELTGE